MDPSIAIPCPGAVAQSWYGVHLGCPSEAAGLLVGEPVEPEVGPDDERLLSLLARGVAVTAIARGLGVSVRTVEYRLRRLRQRWGAASTAELVVLVAERGFRRLQKHEEALRRKDGCRVEGI